jgi:hypothetical protein
MLNLGLCLLVFYGPILLSSGSVLTGITPDPAAHMLASLGDNQTAGRFLHYFDLSVNARLWCDDVVFNPLHLIRWISIALGSNQAGWGALIVGVHSLVFLTVTAYSRSVLQTSATAALTGATVAFFAASWPMWTAAIHPTAALLLLVVSVGEYALFLRTRRRRHLLLCILANALQPYVSQPHSLIPSQAYLLGAVGLMAFFRRRKDAWGSVLPLLLVVWPLSLLGWMPILGPLLYAVGSGLAVRETFAPLRWGVDLSRSTQLLGILFPTPSVIHVLWAKLGISKLSLPAPWFFGSFLFAPCLLALWQSRRAPKRILAVGVALCCLFFLAAESVLVPSPLFRPLWFWLPLAFPMLSGFVVAGGMEALLTNPNPKGLWLLHRLYGLILGVALLGWIALWVVGEQPLTDVVFRLGLGGSGTEIPRLFRGALLFCAGIAVGLLGYFRFKNGKGRGRVIALFVAIAAPALGIGQDWGLYTRHSELDAMLSGPREIQFLQERIPDYTYRVGVLCASEMLLAEGDWKGYWTASSEYPNQVLHAIRLNGSWMRQGLAFALPYIHFYGPVHRELQKEGNPFLKRPDSRKAQLLIRRNVIVRPEADFFDDYGVRYWLSNFDLQRLHPQKFVRVAEGEYGAVFENLSAKPVAYFLDEPQVPLPLQHAPYGVAVALPEQRGGRISLHLDLRRMDARAMDANGHASPLVLQPSGLRWVVDVPWGCSAVVFTAKESVGLRRLSTGSAAVFLLLLGLLFARIP